MVFPETPKDSEGTKLLPRAGAGDNPLQSLKMGLKHTGVIVVGKERAAQIDIMNGLD